MGIRVRKMFTKVPPTLCFSSTPTWAKSFPLDEISAGIGNVLHCDEFPIPDFSAKNSVASFAAIVDTTYLAQLAYKERFSNNSVQVL